MTKRKVSGQIAVWLSSYQGPDAFSREKDEEVLRGVTFTNADLDMTDCGYTRVGVARVTFECPSGQELIDSKAESLRAEIQKTRADAEVKVNALTEKLNKLLALEYAPPADERSALERRQDEIDEDRATEAAEWEARDRFIEGYDA